MRFEYYHNGLAQAPKLSVDGTVDNSIHFSHWQGNRTPQELKADTSTEIALNLVAAPARAELTEGIELVTNNHFDTDGVLSVWTVLVGERAIPLREKLINAAEAGDFSEFSSEDGVRASIVIQGSDAFSDEEEAGSPLAHHLAGAGSVVDNARAYELVLPEVERVITRTGDYEELWRAAWERIAAALESFARGDSVVEEHAQTALSVITLAPAIFSPSGFNPTRHAAPYTAISHYARGQLFLIAVPVGAGFSYRVDYPYYSWAETVVRPRIKRQNFAPLVARLNEIERSKQGRWTLDASELASAFKFVDESGVLSVSHLAPDAVAAEVNSFRQASASSIKDGAAFAGA